jgi:hypothetical protein
MTTPQSPSRFGGSPSFSILGQLAGPTQLVMKLWNARQNIASTRGARGNFLQWSEDSSNYWAYHIGDITVPRHMFPISFLFLWMFAGSCLFKSERYFLLRPADGARGPENGQGPVRPRRQSIPYLPQRRQERNSRYKHLLQRTFLTGGPYVGVTSN